jgi:putative ABC transport system permease protein
MSRLNVGGLFLIVRRSLRQHALSTLVTVISGALASGLVMAVFSIQEQSRAAFTGGATGFDAVLGARGSQLQLVLNTVFHLETSPGNIPWAMYQAMQRDSRVATAVPYAVGDNYRGFRIVGTTTELFTSAVTASGRPLEVAEGGRLFDPQAKEAVVGSFVAQRTGLHRGATFNPYHGVVFNPRMRHADDYAIVGVLKPTNTPSDRVVWIPIDGIYRMSGHVLRGTGTEYTPTAGEAIPDEHKEVSAVMLKLKSPAVGLTLDQTINKQGKVATLAWPIGRVMAELFDKIGWVHSILGLVAYLVVVVVAGSILAIIYNSINERRRDFAILRALGAHRRTVFSTIVLEASVISALGAIGGYVVYAAILTAASMIVRTQTGIVLDLLWFHPVLLFGPLGITLVGAIAGLLPAWKAYQTDVATNLMPTS